MAWPTEELIRIFRLTIPAMPADVVSDEELESDIECYSDYVSERGFGKLYPKALSYFIAHMRTLNGEIAAAGTAADSSLVSGALTSEKEGDLQRSYAAPSGSSSSCESLLAKTMYGQLFLQLQSMCVLPVTVRIGGGRCDYRN